MKLSAMITFVHYACTSLHFKKHSSNRCGHTEYHWILYEYVVVFSSTLNLTGPCRHNVFVNGVMIFISYLLKHFCKRDVYAFAIIMSDGCVVLSYYHQQQDTLLKSLRRSINPLNTELNPICKLQLAKLFCGVFKLCACFSKKLNISRTKWDKFVKQKAFCGEGNRHCSECHKNAVMSLLHNAENKFLKQLVNIHVLLLALWSRLRLFARKTDEKMSYELFFV